LRKNRGCKPRAKGETKGGLNSKSDYLIGSHVYVFGGLLRI